MIKTLQEARDKFDKLFDQAYEILILGFLSDIEHWDIGKLTLGDNGDLVYNEYKIINNFIDLYRVYPRLFDDNENFNNLFYEFQKSITRFSLKDLSSLFLTDISKKNTAKLLSVSLEENKEYTTYYIAFQVRVDAKWKNRIIHRTIYKKLDILHSLYENTNSSRV